MASPVAVLLTMSLVLAVLVGFDASFNSSKSGFLWGVAAFLGGVFGALIYVLVGRDEAGKTDAARRSQSGGRSRERRTPSHRCTSCGEEYYTDKSIDIDTCRSCGGIRVEKYRDL